MPKQYLSVGINYLCQLEIAYRVGYGKFTSQDSNAGKIVNRRTTANVSLLSGSAGEIRG